MRTNDTVYSCVCGEQAKQRKPAHFLRATTNPLAADCRYSKEITKIKNNLKSKKKHREEKNGETDVSS